VYDLPFVAEVGQCIRNRFIDAVGSLGTAGDVQHRQGLIKAQSLEGISTIREILSKFGPKGIANDINFPVTEIGSRLLKCQQDYGSEAAGNSISEARNYGLLMNDYWDSEHASGSDDGDGHEAAGADDYGWAVAAKNAPALKDPFYYSRDIDEVFGAPIAPELADADCSEGN